jgi:hypothetical protein
MIHNEATHATTLVMRWDTTSFMEASLPTELVALVRSCRGSGNDDAAALRKAMTHQSRYACSPGNTSDDASRKSARIRALSRAGVMPVHELTWREVRCGVSE